VPKSIIVELYLHFHTLQLNLGKREI
jgi:hypothetical protein